MWARTIEWLGDRARLIDQTKLPDEEIYVEIKTPEEMYDAIRNMLIRGAPAIGVAAGYGIALAALENSDRNHIKESIELIKSSRPTAYNLFYAAERMERLLENNEIKAEDFVREAIDIHEEDRKLTEKLGLIGQELIPKSSKCMTICNAGALATGGIGTALAVFYMAKERGKSVKVFVPETRPFLQGARLTSWELQKNGVTPILIADSAISWILKTEDVDAIFTGADRIAPNGDVANKIGTYGLSISAKEHGVPFYVVAPTTTFDISIKSGKDIPIEERDSKEIRGFRSEKTAPDNIETRNPAFDVTPAINISGIVTEEGVIKPPFDEGIKELKC